jgi:PleD family two-component response regulator
MLFGAAVIYLHVFPCFGIGVLAVEQGTQQLPRLADLDGLTGLPNRRCFIEQAKPLRLCRYGGEAFCLLLPQTTSLQATKLAARLRQYVSQREFEKSDSLHLPIALSIGVNSRPYKQQVLSLGALFSLADDAHGLAKCQGRNQVMAAASLLESRSKKLKIAIHKYASHSLI